MITAKSLSTDELEQVASGKHYRHGVTSAAARAELCRRMFDPSEYAFRDEACVAMGRLSKLTIEVEVHDLLRMLNFFTQGKHRLNSTDAEFERTPLCYYATRLMTKIKDRLQEAR